MGANDEKLLALLEGIETEYIVTSSMEGMKEELVRREEGGKKWLRPVGCVQVGEKLVALLMRVREEEG